MARYRIVFRRVQKHLLILSIHGMSIDTDKVDANIDIVTKQQLEMLQEGNI